MNNQEFISCLIILITLGTLYLLFLYIRLFKFPIPKSEVGRE